MVRIKTKYYKQMDELRTKGFVSLEAPVLDYPQGIQAAQLFARGCWPTRHSLFANYPNVFTQLSGGVMQIDVDGCSQAVGPTVLGAHLQSLLMLSARGLFETVRCLRNSFDMLYEQTLAPACQYVHQIPAEQVRRMKGRKMLISSRGCQAQLLHLDSLYSTVVANLYLSTDPSTSIKATCFPEELVDTPTFPRDLTDPQISKCLLTGLPWNKRRDMGPKILKHNQAVVFMGNIVHGGPKVTSSSLRIVLFQYATPSTTPDEDLSDYQEFEFSMSYRLLGADASQTRRALCATRGRWKDHYDYLRGTKEFEELERTMSRKHNCNLKVV
jgi:hypothetical protein